MPHLVATAFGSLRDSQHYCSFRPFQPCTKRLGCSRVRSLMAVLGIYNMSTQSLEGSDDPGCVFVRRFDIRAASMQLSWR